MKNLLSLLLILVSATAFSQITNSNINYELRVDQWRQNCDNDAFSSDDNEVRIGLTSDANTGGTATWTSGGDGATCTGNMYVRRWQADAPSTVTNNNTLLYNCTNRVNAANLFTINYSSWEEDGSPDCDHSGDACISTGTYAYTFKSNTKTPSQWWGYSGTLNGSFMTGNDGDFFAKTAWRYTNGAACNSPLIFGTMVSGVAKSHINSNRLAPSGASADKGYVNVSGNNAADVFYQFTLSAASNVVISTINAETNYDTYIRLYDSSCGSQLAFNDDYNGSTRSLISIDLCAGTYIVQVEGFSSNSGDFNLSVQATALTFSGGTIGGITNGVTLCGSSDPGAFTDVASPSGGAGAVAYQWESSTTSATTGFSSISSATALTYDPPALTQTTWFRRKATGCGIPVYSNVIQVVIQAISSTGMVSGDYFWTGVNSDSWHTASNWVVYDGSSFSIPAVAPAVSNNVFIDATSCVQNVANTGSGTANARNLTVRNGAQLNIGSGSTLNIGGSFFNNSGNVAHVAAHGTSTVVFPGSGAAGEIGGSTSTSFGNLTQNNMYGIAIHTETTVRSTLTMNAGFVLNARLILGTSPAAPGTLSYTASSGNILTGTAYFRRYFSASSNSGVSGIMPWGVSSGPFERNARIEYTTAPVSGGWIDARFVPSALSLTTGLPIINDGGVNVTNYMDEGYWEMVPGGGLSGGTYTLTLGRDGIQTVTNASLLRIIKSPNTHTTWVADGSHGGVTASAVSRTGMSGFSWFVIGSNGTNPLPVALLSLSAACKASSVMLYWTSASESNCSHYIVERSEDGSTWAQLGTVQAAGNSSVALSYQFEDASPLRGLAYYRLSQVDFNADQKALLNAISLYCVDFSNPDETVVIYPNPTSGAFTIEINTEQAGTCAMEMIDLTGRKMLSRSASLNAGSNKIFVHEANYPAGTYQLRVAIDGSTAKVYRLVIR